MPRAEGAPPAPTENEQAACVVITLEKVLFDGRRREAAREVEKNQRPCYIRLTLNHALSADMLAPAAVLAPKRDGTRRPG